LKEKLGVRSMPTGEVRLDEAPVEEVGGFAAIAEMMNLSRLYNSVAAVAVMGRAIHEARWYVERRRAFGRPVIEHPLARETLTQLRELDVPATLGAVEVAPLAVDVARMSVSGVPSAELQAAIEQVAAADAVIASAPVYKAGLSGLFKSFVDVLDNDLLIAKPVVLAATAGSSRHALVVDEQMRSLFAYMRALTLPTSVFAAPEDWAAVELGERVRRAATELAVVVAGRIEQGIADRGWSGYEHTFAGNATRAEQTAAGVDFDSPLMRLAAGGRAE